MACNSVIKLQYNPYMESATYSLLIRVLRTHRCKA